MVLRNADKSPRVPSYVPESPPVITKQGSLLNILKEPSGIKQRLGGLKRKLEREVPLSEDSEPPTPPLAVCFRKDLLYAHIGQSGGCSRGFALKSLRTKFFSLKPVCMLDFF